MAKICKIVLTALVLVSGCAVPSLEDKLPEKRPLDGDYSTYTPPGIFDLDKGEHNKVTPIDASGELTLKKAVSLALLHNPQLQAYAWSMRKSQAQYLQAGLWPNPELGIEMENVVGTGVFRGTDSAETTVGIGQLIESGGKRSRRTHIAALESELTAWDFEEQRLAVFAEVTKAFIAVITAQERCRVLNQQVTVAEQVLEAVTKRVAAGKDSALESTKAHVNLTKARIEQKRSLQALSTARQTLAATWGASEALFTKVSGSLKKTATPRELSELQGLVAQHPIVVRWDTEIEHRQARIALEKANALPDPTISGAYRHFNEFDESSFVVGLTLPLPVFNRNQGNILAAQVALAQSRQQRIAALNGIRADLNRAHASWTHAYLTTADLEQTVLPGAQAAFDSAQVGYQNGKYDYLTVLDAQRTLFEARIQHLESLAAYHTAKAEVEYLIGQSMAR